MKSRRKADIISKSRQSGASSRPWNIKELMDTLSLLESGEVILEINVEELFNRITKSSITPEEFEKMYNTEKDKK